MPRVSTQMREGNEAQQSRRGRLPRKVGFYGCNHQVVRLGLRQRPLKSYPKAVRMKCPACGHTHPVSPMWRAWNEKLDAGKHIHFIPAECLSQEQRT